MTNDDRLYYGGPGFRVDRVIGTAPTTGAATGAGRESKHQPGDNGRSIVGDVDVHNKGIVGNEISTDNEVSRSGAPTPSAGAACATATTGTKQKFSNVRKEGEIDRDIARRRDPLRNREQLANLQRPDRGQAERPGLGGGTTTTPPEYRDEIKRPATRKAKRPDTRRGRRATEFKKPQSRPAKPKGAYAEGGAVRRAENPETPRRGAGDRSSAFKVHKGGADRAASKRGVASRGGGSRGGARSHGRRRGEVATRSPMEEIWRTSTGLPPKYAGPRAGLRRGAGAGRQHCRGRRTGPTTLMPDAAAQVLIDAAASENRVSPTSPCGSPFDSRPEARGSGSARSGACPSPRRTRDAACGSDLQPGYR